jgi:uroporphyrinogen decarboxylase
MNSKERFFNLVQGLPVDRRPFGALLSLYGAGLTKCPLERFFNDSESYARGQDAVRQTIGPDFLTGPFLLAGYGEAFGGALRYSDRDVPNLLSPAISSVEEIPNLHVPDVDTNPSLQFIRDAIRRIAKAHGREAVIIGIVLNPLDLPLVIMGLDAWMRTVLTDEDGTRRMLDITIPFFVRLCEALFADGADALAMPMAFFTRDVTTRDIVAKFALPVFREVIPKLKGPVIFHHTGSSFFEYIDLLDTLPGVLGYTMDSRDPLPEARRRIRNEAVLFSGFDGPSLHTLTPDAIRTRCFELLTRMKDDGRFVPFATGTDVDLRTPAEHLIAVKRAVEEFGNG